MYFDKSVGYFVISKENEIGLGFGGVFFGPLFPMFIT